MARRLLCVQEAAASADLGTPSARSTSRTAWARAFASGSARSMRSLSLPASLMATPIREALQPLRGATITNFTEIDATHYSLEYQLNGQKYYVNYGVDGHDYTFEFVDVQGKKTVETYHSHE